MKIPHPKPKISSHQIISRHEDIIIAIERNALLIALMIVSLASMYFYVRREIHRMITEERLERVALVQNSEGPLKLLQ